MKKRFKLGIIGCGFMAQSIINGIISSNIISPNDIIVSDKHSENLEKVSKLSINTTMDNLYLSNNSEFILFAVKPQALSLLIEQIKGAKIKKIISIMAGVRKEKLKKYFNEAFIARAMPNTPCSIGCGAIGLDCFDFDDKDCFFIKSIFSSLGYVALVDEEKLNVITAISGSSPAYFYTFVNNLINSGVKKGLSFEDSFNLVVCTMIGSGKMIQKNSALNDLIKSVCSKGGTTIEALKVFDDKKLDLLIDDAVNACIKRAEELEKL